MAVERFILSPHSRAGVGGDNEGGRIMPQRESQPTSPAPLSNQRRQHQQQWPTSHVPGDDFMPDSERSLTRGRAATIDAIAHKLSRQHLRLDAQSPPPFSHAPISTSSSATAYRSLADFKLEVDPLYLESSPSVESRPTAASSMSTALDPSGPPREEDKDLPRQRSFVSHKINRLRRKLSPMFHDAIQDTRAVKRLAGGMLCTRTQCNVLASQLTTPTDPEAHDSNEMEVDPTSPEVDGTLGDGANFEKPLLERFMEAHRVSGPLGNRKNGFPLYRSSTETALRCRNLVRNKPRMRKRTKLRDRPGLAARSAATGSALASTSTAS